MRPRASSNATNVKKKGVEGGGTGANDVNSAEGAALEVVAGVTFRGNSGVAARHAIDEFLHEVCLLSLSGVLEFARAVDCEERGAMIRSDVMGSDEE